MISKIIAKTIKKTIKKSMVVRAVLVFFIVMLLLLLSSLSYVGTKEMQLRDKIYPNVYLDDVNVGGKTKFEALKPYGRIDSNLSKIKIDIFYKDTQVATLSAKTLNLRSDAKDVVERAYLIGRSTNEASKIYQRISTILGISRFSFKTNLVYDEGAIAEAVQTLEETYNKPAKDALFKFEGGRVVNFRPETNGLRIKSDEIKEDVRGKIAEIESKPGNKKINIEEEILKPRVTLASSNDFGIEELIGVGKSDFSGSIPGRIHNIALSASRFNGVLIPKGAVFSFNDTVGDISSSTGYQQAYVIKAGRTVLGDGGGVCQTSTTLFRAALKAGLPILERTAHAYRVGYYENDAQPGFDATVFGPTVDLKIKNNTPASILIQTEVVGSILYFRFYGKRDDRKVHVSQATVWDVVPAPEPKNEDDPTMKKGQVKQVDWAALGAKSKFAYNVSSASNPEVNFSKEFYSAFRPWQAVFLVGTAD